MFGRDAKDANKTNKAKRRKICTAKKGKYARRKNAHFNVILFPERSEYGRERES